MWTNFGNEEVIPRPVKTPSIDFLISKKSLTAPCESKYEVIPDIKERNEGELE